MSQEEVKAILDKFLLAFQICLALWQFSKLTPLGALVKGVVGCLLRPLGLFPSYTRLKSLDGLVFKTVKVYVFEDRLKSPARPRCNKNVIMWQYLGKTSRLERRGSGSGRGRVIDKNMLLVNDSMRYYITQRIWDELAFTANSENPEAVFIENYKEIWENVATGRDMTFEEVLDHIILDSHTLRRIGSSSVLLPVDLSVSEEKVLKMLNLAGFFLQTKEVYWLIPPLLSFISMVLELATPLRIRIYEKINALFCRAMRVIFDRLPHSMRRKIYGLGKLVDNLKPTNDIKLKVMKGDITATIAGGAKVHTEGALTLLGWYHPEATATETAEPAAIFDNENIRIQCSFRGGRACYIEANTVDPFSVECRTRDGFRRIVTLVQSIATNGSGSLKSYEPHPKVCVRGLRETLFTYVANALPEVYEMKLKNVVVN